jgi:hypothetical protein
MAHHTTIKLTLIKWNAQVFNNYKWSQVVNQNTTPFVLMYFLKLYLWEIIIWHFLLPFSIFSTRQEDICQKNWKFQKINKLTCNQKYIFLGFFGCESIFGTY